MKQLPTVKKEREGQVGRKFKKIERESERVQGQITTKQCTVNKDELEKFKR